MAENMIKISEFTKSTTYIVDSRLCFENGRLFVHRIPYENGKPDFSEEIDVTEDVLDALLKILNKRKEEAHQNSIINQLNNR